MVCCSQLNSNGKGCKEGSGDGVKVDGGLPESILVMLEASV